MLSKTKMRDLNVVAASTRFAMSMTDMAGGAARGGKTAAAAAKLFPSAVAITWPSGCKAIDKADWAPLIGRNCTLWPDADAPGIQAMDKLSAKLLNLGAAQVRIITPPAGVPEGWDLADADWSIAQAAAYLKANRSAPTAAAAPDRTGSGAGCSPPASPRRARGNARAQSSPA